MHRIDVKIKPAWLAVKKTYTCTSPRQNHNFKLLRTCRCRTNLFSVCWSHCLQSYLSNCINICFRIQCVYLQNSNTCSWRLRMKIYSSNSNQLKALTKELQPWLIFPGKTNLMAIILCSDMWNSQTVVIIINMFDQLRISSSINWSVMRFRFNKNRHTKTTVLTCRLETQREQV